MRVGNQPVPAFYQGYIYWVGLAGGDSYVTIYAPDGHLALSFETQNGSVQSIAIDTDGTTAVAWGSWSSKKAGGIDFRDSSGTFTRTVVTTHCEAPQRPLCAVVRALIADSGRLKLNSRHSTEQNAGSPV
jgi:hypothetical protein